MRVVTFGDSNTDYGYAATESILEARSYVSNRLAGRLAASAPHHPAQLAGLIEAGWVALDRSTITVVNHGSPGPAREAAALAATIGIPPARRTSAPSSPL